MNPEKSPLAPKHFPDMPDIDGVRLWTGESGIKYKGRPDILLAHLDPGSRIAGVFTRSTAPGAPVTWSQSCLSHHARSAPFDQASGILVNAGNANVFTGQAGQDGLRDMAGFTADILGCPVDNVFVASTGVIGEPLATGPVIKVLSADQFTKKASTWKQAALAITTTDTFCKGATARAEIAGSEVRICGIAKGSGMIMPDMATLLSFIFTDAHITQPVLQEILSELCQTTFNAITVDSDTSTSDTALLATSAKAGHDKITQAKDPRLSTFRVALAELMLDLAHQIVKDGEGASKFIKITVNQAETDMAAKVVAMSIANSPLVKTAIAGEDANWGRIVMAVGKSGEKANRDALSIKFGPHLVAENGLCASEYDEAKVSRYMLDNALEISVNIGVGSGFFTVWTCDLTHNYININADYRS